MYRISVSSTSLLWRSSCFGSLLENRIGRGGSRIRDSLHNQNVPESPFAQSHHQGPFDWVRGGISIRHPEQNKRTQDDQKTVFNTPFCETFFFLAEHRLGVSWHHASRSLGPDHLLEMSNLPSIGHAHKTGAQSQGRPCTQVAQIHLTSLCMEIRSMKRTAHECHGTPSVSPCQKCFLVTRRHAIQWCRCGATGAASCVRLCCDKQQPFILID